MPISQINQNSLATGVPSATNITTGTLPSARLPTGCVLQLVRTSDLNSAGISTTSATAVSTGITVSITPQRSNSLIRVDWVSSMAYAASSLTLQMYANGVTVGGLYSAGYMTTGYMPQTSTLYFTPGTTTSQTYTVYFLSGSATVYAVHPQAAYSLTATEIAV
jgi:hypothetical protein